MRKIACCVFVVLAATPSLAASLFTPRISGQLTDNIFCSGENFGPTQVEISVTLRDGAGQIIASNRCVTIPFQGCAASYRGVGQPTCEISVKGSKNAIRGSISAYAPERGGVYLQLPAN